MKGGSVDNAHTGLILLTGEDSPGALGELFHVLSPFSLTILDIEQMVIRNRLFLTILISLNPAHGAVIESDLMEYAAVHNVDIAISFSESEGSAPLAMSSQSTLTILGDPLRPSAIARLAAALTQCEASIRSVSRLATSPYSTHQFIITGSSPEILQSTLSQIVLAEEFSLLTDELRLSRKLVVLDVDSTLIDQEVIDLLALRAGVAEEVQVITNAAMRGELDFAQSLAARVQLLKGLPVSVFAEIQAEITLTLGAKELISSLLRLGHVVGLVTGGFAEIVTPLANELGITHLRANTLEINEGYLTGKVQGLVIDRAGKAKALAEFAALEAIPLSHTVAIGDGANDLDMLEMAGLSIAFGAKRILQESADINIHQRDLGRVLTLLGIPRAN